MLAWLGAAEWLTALTGAGAEELATGAEVGPAELHAARDTQAARVTSAADSAPVSLELAIFDSLIVVVVRGYQVLEHLVAPLHVQHTWL